MAASPVPPGAVRLRLLGDPSAEQTLKAGRHMLRLLREIEREMRRTGALPPGPEIRWRLTIEDDAEAPDGD